ncbi:MAG: hypothetical protein KAR32_15180 [Candidatus Omnitrophica bacterium]|nr:hypothetical protein [Candidatus Omnitrophota bacterium]MCK5259469.1 hypothetical protein [Candidatus Omnitrophota bacterium]
MLKIRSLRIHFLLVFFLASMTGTADAYIGPGAGLGLVGFLIAVIIAVLVIFLGLILYPLKMLIKYIKSKKQPKKKK